MTADLHAVVQRLGAAKVKAADRAVTTGEEVLENRRIAAGEAGVRAAVGKGKRGDGTDAAAGPAARANLRTAVWALRKAIGDDALMATRTTVGLRPEAVTTDLADGRRRAAAGDVSAAAVLCHGELLAGYADDWAETARREYRTDLAEALAASSAAAERDGDVAAAARWSRLRCGLDPLNEAAHADLVRHLAAAGDRAGALIAGREVTDRLRAELGVRPGPLLRAALAEKGEGEVGGESDQLERLRSCGLRYRRFAFENRHYYAIMFEAAIPHEFGSPEVAEHAAAAFGELVRNVEMAAAAGGIAAPDPREVAQQIWSSVHGAVALEMKGLVLTPDPEATYRATLHTLLRGLAP